MASSCPCVLLAVVLIGWSAAGCTKHDETANGPGPAATPPVPAAKAAVLPDDAWVAVRTETLREFAPAIGTLRARQSTRLGSQVSGRVAQVLVDVGARVKLDQVLVRLDPALFQIDVQQQEAAVTAARGALAATVADVDYAARELARQEGLRQSGAGSQKELDDARTASERAVASRDEQQGKLAEAEQKLAYARQRLAETEIRAPYDGVVTERLIDPGDMAASSPPTDLLEIRAVASLYLEFSLPQELLGVVREGTPLEFEVEGVTAAPVSSAVAIVFPAVDEATRSFRCRAVIGNADGRLQAGTLARVRVVEREMAQALVVPRSALLQTANGWQVFVPNDGHPVPRAVQVGLRTDTAAEIVAGLGVGERVLAVAERAR